MRSVDGTAQPRGGSDTVPAQVAGVKRRVPGVAHAAVHRSQEPAREDRSATVSRELLERLRT